MQKTLKILSGVLLVLTLCGCGKTNFLQWASPQKNNDINQARRIIDTAKSKSDYEKAYDLVRNDNSNDGQILRASALLGMSDIDLAKIIDALGKDKITIAPHPPSDSPVLKLESLIADDTHRRNVLEAAELFSSSSPSKTSDKMIGALIGLLAHTANLRNAAAEPFSVFISSKSAATPCGDFWSNLGNDEGKFVYITMAADFLSGGEESLRDAIAEAKDALQEVFDDVDALPPIDITWNMIKSLFGY